MKLKSVVLLVMALGCGLVAMLGVQQILSGNRNTDVPDTVKVLVAKQEITPGIRLEEPLVAFEDWPKASVPQGAVTEPQQYEMRALKSRAFPGEVILEAKLGEKGAIGASSAIAKGMRVVTVPVNMTTTHSGMIRPGDRVDILVTYKVQKAQSAASSRTKVVLERIEVFALDRMRDNDSSDNGASKSAAKSAENLSVIVTPEQANLLMLAKSKGELQMSLRNPDDKEAGKTVTMDEAIFEGSEASQGIDVPDEGGPKMAQSTEGKNFNEFLKKSAVTEEPAEVAEPTKKFWTIDIYEGETKRVEKVELPDDSKELEKAPKHDKTPEKAPTAKSA